MKYNKETKYMKYIVRAFSIVVLISGILFWFLMKHELRVEKYEVKHSLSATLPYRFNIDNITQSQAKIVLSGWLIKEKHDIGVIHRQVVFKSKTSRYAVKVATEIVERKDLTMYMNDGVNYADSGFFAVVEMAHLDRANHDYEIYVLDKSDEDEQMVKIADSLNEELEKHDLRKAKEAKK